MLSSRAAGNASAPSAPLSVTTSAAALSIVDIWVVEKTASRATVRVRTSEPSRVTIAYGTSATSLSMTSSSETIATSHDVVLSGLSAKTKVHYRATAVNAAGQSASSSVLNFRTSSR